MVTAIPAVPLELATTEARKIDLSRTYKLAEFMVLPDNGKQYELVRGALVEMQGPSIGHGTIIATLSAYLNIVVLRSRLGLVSSNAAFVFDPINNPNTARRPDVSFVNKTRLQGIDYNDAFPLAPDLAVEVVSKTDIWYEVSGKVTEYKEANVPLIWVIFPPEQLVLVYQQGQKVKTLLADDELDGQDVIPDFKLRVSALFDWENMLEQQTEA